MGGGRDERPGNHLHAAQSAGDAERRAGRRGGGRTVAIAIDVGVGRVEGGEKEERKKRKESGADEKRGWLVLSVRGRGCLVWRGTPRSSRWARG